MFSIDTGGRGGVSGRKWRCWSGGKSNALRKSFSVLARGSCSVGFRRFLRQGVPISAVESIHVATAWTDRSVLIPPGVGAATEIVDNRSGSMLPVLPLRSVWHDVDRGRFGGRSSSHVGGSVQPGKGACSTNREHRQSSSSAYSNWRRWGCRGSVLWGGPRVFINAGHRRGTHLQLSYAQAITRVTTCPSHHPASAIAAGYGGNGHTAGWTTPPEKVMLGKLVGKEEPCKWRRSSIFEHGTGKPHGRKVRRALYRVNVLARTDQTLERSVVRSCNWDNALAGRCCRPWCPGCIAYGAHASNREMRVFPCPGPGPGHSSNCQYSHLPLYPSGVTGCTTQRTFRLPRAPSRRESQSTEVS